MTHPRPVPGSGPSPSGAVIDGRGRQAITMWTRRRAEAGLPEVGSWDGPLVALAIALMWDKGVAAETQRFRQARAEVLDDFQIALDLRIGHDCVAEFIDRGESQRGTWSSPPTGSPTGSSWDLFLSLVGRRVEGAGGTRLGTRLPFPRPSTA